MSLHGISVAGRVLAGYICVQDQKTAGTDGGSSTSGSWQTRTLNTKVVDTDDLCSLASNQITLVAGIYVVRATSAIYQSALAKIRLRDTTSSVTLAVGDAVYADPSGGGYNTMPLAGRFTIAASKALEIQYRCSAAKATNGLGAGSNFDEVEVFTTVELWKIA